MFSTNKDNKAFEVFPKRLGAKLVVTKVYYCNYYYFIIFFTSIFHASKPFLRPRFSRAFSFSVHFNEKPSISALFNQPTAKAELKQYCFNFS